MRRYLDFYLMWMKTAVLIQIQYRAQNYFYMIGLIAEPVIYLVVWSSVARAQGGSVGGYTVGAIAAYYIVWTLVRNMNVVFNPYGWQDRMQHGQLTGELLRPMHPLHADVAGFAGWKLVVIVLWLPLAAAMTLVFRPEIHPSWLQGLVFFMAIWGAYLIRTMLLTVLGLICFWTTRVGAIYELYFALELVLSGRLVPMTFMPAWVQTAAAFLPFQWTFYFPINALVGQPTPSELLAGLAYQWLWILIGLLFVNIVWRFGIRRFASVGN